MQFNHDDRKDALMPLLGSHTRRRVRQVPHQERLQPAVRASPIACGNAGCHVSPHDGHLFGTRPCEWCHSPTFKTLKQQNFDHTEKTKFDLGPAHRKIKCYDCHTKALGEGKPNAACELCHAKDSHHGERFKEFGDPPKCGMCHPSGGPKFTPSAFNHYARHEFKLEFKHAEVTCRECHRGKPPSDFEDFRDLVDKNGNVQCMGCHAHAKVHADAASEGQVQERAVPECHMHPGDPTIRTGKQQVRRARTTARRHVPARQGPQGRAVRRLPHRPHEERQDVVREDLRRLQRERASATRTRCTRARSARSARAATSPGTWDALNFDHHAPFPEDAKGEVKSSRSRAST